MQCSWTKLLQKNKRVQCMLQCMCYLLENIHISCYFQKTKQWSKWNYRKTGNFYAQQLWGAVRLSHCEWRRLNWTVCDLHSGYWIYWRQWNLWRGLTRTRSTASSLVQVANLPCAQANSASYPQWDVKWVVAHLLWATGWRPKCGWLGRWCVC